MPVSEQNIFWRNMSRVSLKILKIVLILQQIRMGEKKEETQYGATAIKCQASAAKAKGANRGRY